MTINTKTIRTTAETSFEEFNNIKEFLSNLDEGYYSYVNNYVIAYVLLKNHYYEATKINDVHIDDKTNTVTIDFESEYLDKRIDND